MGDRETDVGRVAIGATYEGDDPSLLGRLVAVVDYLEVTPDSIALGERDTATIDPAVLEQLRDVAAAGVGIVAHGVGLSIGSASGWNEHYLGLVDELFAAVPLRWHSEHLGYTTVDGEPLGTMLSLPRTEEALELVCERVETIKSRFGAPFLLENIVRMLPDLEGDYDDAGFLNELCARTGCGLVLDLYNLECDAHNHGFDIDGFLEQLDVGAVRELHVAGGVELEDMRLDVHSRPAEPSTLQLASTVAGSAPALWGATYEYLPEAVPSLGHNAIVHEVERLRASIAPA